MLRTCYLVELPFDAFVVPSLFRERGDCQSCLNSDWVKVSAAQATSPQRSCAARHSRRSSTDRFLFTDSWFLVEHCLSNGHNTRLRILSTLIISGSEGATRESRTRLKICPRRPSGSRLSLNVRLHGFRGCFSAL